MCWLYCLNFNQGFYVISGSGGFKCPLSVKGTSTVLSWCTELYRSLIKGSCGTVNIGHTSVIHFLILADMEEIKVDYKVLRNPTLTWRSLLDRNLLRLLRRDNNCGGGGGGGGGGAGQVWLVHGDGDGAVGLVGGDGGGGAVGALAVGQGGVAVLADGASELVVVSFGALFQAFGELSPVL